MPVPVPGPAMYGSPAPAPYQQHHQPPGYHQPTLFAAPTPTHPRRVSTASFTSQDGSGPPMTSGGATTALSLSLPLPDPGTLATAREKALALGDQNRLLQWASDIMKYVERKSILTANSGTAAEADLAIKDAQLVGWIDEAIGIVNVHAAKVPTPVPRALYLRGDLLASGSFPSYHQRDLRSAFSDFEIAARMGYPPAYFRCARDYEVLGDVSRAKEVYEKGMGKGDVCCTYRLGMANLLGQLGLTQNLPRAAQLLSEAADRADLETPQPAYIYGIILAGEFAQVSVPPNVLMPALVTDPNRSNLTPQQHALFEAEAFRHISRAAFLHFGPAQLKCGWAFEHAQLGCAFDPLLSVQYYILASQGGELEADLSLSKWFLCGADGFFPKKEDLAFAQIKSDHQKAGSSSGGGGGGGHGPAGHPAAGAQHKQAVDVSRRQTMKMVDAYTSVSGRPGPGMAAPWSESSASVVTNNAAGGYRRQGRQEASMPNNMPAHHVLTRPVSSSASSTVSSSVSVSQGQHGAGYSLSESYHHNHQPVPTPASAGAGVGVGGMVGTSPGRKVLAKVSPSIPVHATSAAGARPGFPLSASGALPPLPQAQGGQGTRPNQQPQQQSGRNKVPQQQQGGPPRP
ncbi:unnamed protein product, partial [Tilletia caries]